ncbi:MAG: hypothetical protein ABIP51_22570 [Bacteroidia bacterium]
MTRSSRNASVWHRLKVIEVKKYEVECEIINPKDEYTKIYIPLFTALQSLEYDKPYTERKPVNDRFDEYVKSLNKK